ncbi:MAG: hypothetical protein AAFX52_11190 [Pseudomonadota bacterium]
MSLVIIEAYDAVSDAGKQVVLPAPLETVSRPISRVVVAATVTHRDLPQAELVVLTNVGSDVVYFTVSDVNDTSITAGTDLDTGYPLLPGSVRYFSNRRGPRKLNFIKFA